ncbi:MAG: ferredoxin [Acidimicrobiia bacterium]
MRVTVDADICGGHGACLSAAPEVFRLTDDGWAEVLVDEVPAGMEAAVEQAALHCPTKAIIVS